MFNDFVNWVLCSFSKLAFSRQIIYVGFIIVQFTAPYKLSKNIKKQKHTQSLFTVL